MRIHLFVAAATAAACSTPTSPEGQALTREQWEWQTACCSIAGATLTRDAAAADYVLTFGANGRVTARRNDTLLLETGYRIEVTQSDGDETTTVAYDDPLPLVPGVEPAERQVVTLRADGALVLRNLAPCADCFGEWTFFARLSGNARSSSNRLGQTGS